MFVIVHCVREQSGGDGTQWGTLGLESPSS